MVSLLLSVIFGCGLLIAVLHVVNRPFVAPVYDVIANVVSFSCAATASLLLGHTAPGLLSSVAVLCWLFLARRTYVTRKQCNARQDFAVGGGDEQHSSAGKGPVK